MAIFTITAVNPATQEKHNLFYDSSLSTLKWENGESVIADVKTSQPVEQQKLDVGKRNLSTIKIQLGLLCNFECEYCNQRFVPHADQTNPDDVEPFVNNMHNWYKGGEDGKGLGTVFEFWGGEPFVYWKTLKPLTEALFLKYPNSKFSVITNGSLLDIEKLEWLQKYNFNLGISHDGPGQHVRGPDPFENPSSKEAILETFKRLAPFQKMSFNPMIHSRNVSRQKIEEYFENFIKTNLGDEWLQYLAFGEGGFIDAYDEGGVGTSLTSDEMQIEFRNSAFKELREGKVNRFNNINKKIMSFIETIENGTRFESIRQKCGMDREDNIAIDLNGNVLTCQNVSPVSVNPSGISHHLGHVSDLESVEIKTGTHLNDRDECPKCPVVHMCKGGCFFLTGSLWETTCNNAYSDNIVTFTAAIEIMTGLLPVYIDGPLRDDRKDMYWWVHGKPEHTKGKKIIPIMSV